MSNNHKFTNELKQLVSNLKNKAYTNSEVFLKELLQNANQAVSKLKNLKDENKYKEELNQWEGMLEVYFDKADGSITIVDNGIGMNKEELFDLTHTIATKKAESFLSSNSKEVSNLGLYSLFLVGVKANIISKKLAEDTAYKWTSDEDGFTLAPCINDEGSGTVIYIKLKDEFAKEFTNKDKLKEYISKFQDSLSTNLYISYHEGLDERVEKIN